MPDGPGRHRTRGHGVIEFVKMLNTLYSVFRDSPTALLCPDRGEVHSPADYDEDEEDTGKHVAFALTGLQEYGALAFTGDAGGVLTLTPLGRMLVDTVYAAFAPSAEDSPAAVVTRLAAQPAGAMVMYARDWLAARTPVDAARELIGTAESATPRLRAAAFDLATEIGPRAIPALLEHAETPGYGAYVRQWLAEQGEDASVFARDEAWMQVEEMSALIERTPEGFATLALQAAMMQAGPGYSAELVKTLRESGHPDAPRLLEMVRGVRSENIRHTPKAPDNAKPLQYNYDFGDDWIHEIKSEGFYHNGIGTPLPFILDGSGACPPEDSGGPYQYEYLKTEILTNPDHEEHDDMLDWLGIDSAEDFDPTAFSVDDTPSAKIIRLQPRTKKSKSKR